MSKLVPFDKFTAPSKYDQAWMSKTLHHLQQSVGRYATVARERNVKDLSYIVADVRRYGAIGDEDTDDTDAFSEAAYAASKANVGKIIVPPGYRFRVTSGFTFSSGITVACDAVPAGGIASTASVTSGTILHDFDGTLFTFDGADGSLPGSGGGLRNLRLVQVNGGGITANGKGTAVKLTGIDSNHLVHWVYLDHVIAEYSTGDSWTHFLHVDGLTPGAVVSDLFVNACSAHIASSNGYAVKMEYGSGQFFNCSFYDTAGHVLITGDATHKSSATNFIGCNISGIFALDYADGVNLFGGIVTQITDTVNTTGQNVFTPGKLVTAFGSNAGNACHCLNYDHTTAELTASQSLRVRDSIYAAKMLNNGATSFGSALAATAYQLYADASLGAVLAGYGTTNDVTIANKSGQTVLAIPTGTKRAEFAGEVLSLAPLAGVGYGTGAGGSVTQATSKATAVTLNKVTGAITLNNAALAAGASVTFTVNNTAVLTGDVPLALHASAGTAGSYRIDPSNVVTGTSFDLTVTNITGGSLSEAIVINFALLRGASA